VATTDVRQDELYFFPYDSATYQDPYPTFARLREEAPLYYNEEHDFYAVSRFADVERGLVERDTFLNSHGDLLDLLKSGVEFPPGTLIYEEPPVHTIHRALISRVFTPRAMNAIEPAVRDFCVRRLGELAGSGGFDYVNDFARFIPMRVFGMLLGIPEEHQLGIVEHVEAGLKRDADTPQDYSEGFSSGDYYAPFVDERYETPTEDLITRLMTSEFTDEEGVTRTLTRTEVLGYLNILAGAGNETTNRLIGWTGKLLGERPDVRREVGADRSLIPAAVEEALRFEPSSMYVGRYVGRDTEMCGQPLPEGSALLCLVGSANRDETVFEHADQYDVHREIPHHLTFGYGPHFCLGAALARLEARVALDEMLNHFPDWELDVDNCKLGLMAGVRGWESLPVTIP
jgi:cytochrome P450